MTNADLFNQIFNLFHLIRFVTSSAFVIFIQIKKMSYVFVQTSDIFFYHRNSLWDIVGELKVYFKLMTELICFAG